MTPERYQRILAVLKRRQPDLTVLTEDVHKPHNISAIVRTCDAVGVFEVNCLNSIETEDTPTFKQIARGSQKWIYLQDYREIETPIRKLQQRKFKVYAAHFSPKAIDYREIDYTQPTAILLGAEKWGVSDRAASLVDGHIIIPMLGMVKSLNVSVAAAVILFEAQRQRLQANFYDRPRLDSQTFDRTLFEWCYPDLCQFYRQSGKPYPKLGENGEILDNSDTLNFN
ncbi:MAG: tRNA (guanosine(18)-2'-O)-methyltransferase TrmH [Prochloraceae cyanobacterium]|nr:tRNA (guanosine(18)-2'-O)-methyltransferase TrmH [Prochloraceae cyanobacterium]